MDSILSDNHETLMESFFKFFKYPIAFFLISNLFLFAIGRNMYKWNKNSDAQKLINNEFKKIFYIRF